MSTGSPRPVPGFEDQGLTWSDSFEVVTISMPITADNLRSLAVHTDGATLSLQWDRGSVVINLYAAILESHTGPARVKKGVFHLPMRKAAGANWPSLVKAKAVVDPITSDSKEEEPSLFCGIAGCVGSCE